MTKLTKPEVSVIIPTYNRANFLINAINSVLLQTITQYEVIVIDDGSRDNTQEIISNLPGCVRYIPIQHSGLPAIARNVGINNAEGTYIAFLDSDDCWCENKLEQQIYYLKEHENVGLVCSNGFILHNSSKSRLFFPDNTTNSKRDYFDLIKNNFIITSSCLVKKDLLERVGLFSEDILLRGIEDYDLWLNVGLISDIHYMHEPLCFYRIHEKRISNEPQVIPHYEALIYMFSQILKNGINYSNQNNGKVEKSMKHRIYTLKLEIMRLFYLSNEKEKAKSLLKDLLLSYIEFTPRTLLTFFKTIIRY